MPLFGLWSDEAAHAFATVKDAMCTTPILAMLDFNETFALECDASSRGLRVA